MIDLSAWKASSRPKDGPPSPQPDLPATLERISKELHETSLAIRVIIQHINDMNMRLNENERLAKTLARIIAQTKSE